MARGLLLTVVLLATSMIIGDGVLTPAISVISAIQGLTNASSNINNSAPRCTPLLFALKFTYYQLCRGCVYVNSSTVQPCPVLPFSGTPEKMLLMFLLEHFFPNVLCACKPKT